MSSSFRSAVLALLVLVFFFLGGAAVLYAQGWRVKLNPWTASKVGGVYIRSLPTDAEVLINGKRVARTAGIFERGILEGNLFPGNYAVTVRKEGFRDWRDTLPVKPSQVTSRTHIMLLPEEAKTATSGIAAVRRIGGSAVLLGQNGRLYWKNTQVPGDTPVAELGGGQALLTKNRDSYFIWDASAATSTNVSRTFPRLGLVAKTSSTIIAVPGNGLSFLVWSSSSLRLANPVTGRPTTLEENARDVAAAAAGSSRIAWARFDRTKKISYISLYDLPSETFIPNADFVPGRVRSMTFTGRNSLLILADDGTLYSLSPGEGSRIKTGENVGIFAYSAPESALAFTDGDGLNITSGRRNYTFMRIPDSENLAAITWLEDGFHLLLEYKNKTLLLDTEDADLSTMAELPGGQTFYSAADNSFGYLDNGVLKTLAFPR